MASLSVGKWSCQRRETEKGCVCVCVCVCVAILTLNIRFLVMYMCVCVTEMGCAGDVNRMVTRDLHIYSTLYCMHMITSGHSWGAAAEVDAVGEQQLKPTQSGSSS